MLKKIFIVAFLFIVHCPLFIISSAQPQSDSVTITTYYPSPAGVYRELRLFPSNVGTVTNSCVGQEGDMFYDQATFALVVCAGSPATWTQLGGGGGGGGSLWTNTTTSLYPNNPTWNVGIGTTSPRGHFDVDGSGDIWLTDDGLQSGTQSIFLPGHIYMVPYGAGNTVYLQARRSDNTGTTALRLRTYNAGVLTEAVHITGTGSVGIGTTNPSIGNQALKVDVEGAVGATVYCDENGNNCKTPSQIATLPTCAEGDFLKFSGGTWICSGSGPCTPNCACAASTCVGSTCPNGCGGTCAGTKSCCTPSCACAASTCKGSTCPNGCGGTCAGTKSCCTPDCSCATKICQGSTCPNGCGGTCVGIRLCSCPETGCVPADAFCHCGGGTQMGCSCCLHGYPRCVPADVFCHCGGGIQMGCSCCLLDCPTCVPADVFCHCGSGIQIGCSCCIY